MLFSQSEGVSHSRRYTSVEVPSERLGYQKDNPVIIGHSLGPVSCTKQGEYPSSRQVRKALALCNTEAFQNESSPGPP